MQNGQTAGESVKVIDDEIEVTKSLDNKKQVNPDGT